MDDLHKRWPGFIAAVTTAEAGSFSAAARQLDLTPAAVGKSVAQLEQQLGVRLFNRTTRQLSLTDEGERVVSGARAAMAALTEVGNVAPRGQAVSGLVRISCSVGFGRRYVLPVVAALLDAHPALRIELNLSDHNADLVREGFDIGIRGGSTPPLGMVAQRICTVPTRLIASPEYLARQGVPTDWSQLHGHRLIGVRLASGRHPAWGFRSGAKTHALDVAAVLTLSAPDLVVDAALLHQGIAQVGLHHAWDAIESGRLKTLLTHQHVPSPLPLALFYPHRSGIAPRVKCVVDTLLLRLRGDVALSRVGKARAA